MNSDRLNFSIIEPDPRVLTARRRVSPSAPRRTVPPPIFLCLENQLPRLGSRAAEILEPKETTIIPLIEALPIQASARVEMSNPKQSAVGLLARGLNWIRARQVARSNNKGLRVAASVSLGEKRFIAVVQVDGLQFLIGGGAANVALLAHLNGRESFEGMLKETLSVQAQAPTLAVVAQAEENE